MENKNRDHKHSINKESRADIQQHNDNNRVGLFLHSLNKCEFSPKTFSTRSNNERYMYIYNKNNQCKKQKKNNKKTHLKHTPNGQCTFNEEIQANDSIPKGKELRIGQRI